MKTCNRLIVGALAVALAAAACDPYASENKDAPYIAAVFATDGDATNGAFAVDGTGSGSTWTIADIPSTCFPDPATPSTGTVLADAYAIFVTANKLLSGASIETTAGSCIPAGNWLTATTPPTGQSWFTCYYPSSPSVDLGGSVVIFKTAAYTDTDSWNAVATLEGDPFVTITYTMSGSVSDQQGHPLALNVTATVAPSGSVGQTPALTATASAIPGQIDLTWGNGACAGTPTYTVQRAGASLTTGSCPSSTSTSWATIQSGLAVRAYSDIGLTSGLKYCYRVFVTVGGVDGANSSVKSATAP